MGKNIALLYMSAYFAQPAPEGSKNRFLRTQTNEAAVSALWKAPCIPAGQDRGPVQRHGPDKADRPGGRWLRQ